MIKSLLVANRGEIACRIFRTARRLGVRTIAVYSDADARARHVREADEAVRIGPAAAARELSRTSSAFSQRRAPRGAEAIHPGLRLSFGERRSSRRPASMRGWCSWVRRPRRSPPWARRSSPRRACARRACRCCPAMTAREQDLEHSRREALRAGTAAHHQARRGRRRQGHADRHAREPSSREALAAARRLAESAFGDGALLLERYLPAAAPRRGAGVRRRARQLRAPRRPRLLHSAPASEADRGGAGARRCRMTVRERLRAAALVVAREIGYVERRHGRVPVRRPRVLLSWR